MTMVRNLYPSHWTPHRAQGPPLGQRHKRLPAADPRRESARGHGEGGGGKGERVFPQRQQGAGLVQGGRRDRPDHGPGTRSSVTIVKRDV